jgi:hypothetical protein
MEFDIEWLQERSQNQALDIFYCEGYEHSPVCYISGNKRKVLISCDGEMRGIFSDKSGDEVIITDFWDLIDAGIETDDDYLELKEKIEWDFNPWFTAYDVTNNYDPDLGHDTFTCLEFVEGDLDEIISKVKDYISKGMFYENI